MDRLAGRVELLVIPCILHEDEHLLVANKPAGISTHAPSPFAGEGIHEWLKHREPRWSDLAIIHRLDKETSGVIVFGKSRLANQSLTQQFTDRQVLKSYLLLTDRPPKEKELVVRSRIVRRGARYESGTKGEEAETRYILVDLNFGKSGHALVRAEPLTGRTHQIRVQSAESGFPVLGDELYGGSAFHRVCLHAESIRFRHPESGREVSFDAPVDFNEDSRSALRCALINPVETDSFRLIHGASDGWPGWYVDRLGDYLLSQGEGSLSEQQIDGLNRLVNLTRVAGAYHKALKRQVRKTTPEEASAVQAAGGMAPERFTVKENGVRFELSFGEGYSTGLFLDQRDNRRRLMTGHVAAGFDLPAHAPPAERSELLNTFAYTCAFSVCAAKSAMRTTSLDLSRKYLDWGRQNFELNGLDPGEHDFIYGDVFDWLKRLAKKGRVFDVILLDPPTFSQSKVSGVFQSGKHYGRLVSAALPLLKPNGVLFASTNNTQLKPEKFLEMIESAIRSARRKIVRHHYVPQPPDFPVSRAEPAYLKTVWLQVS